VTRVEAIVREEMNRAGAIEMEYASGANPANSGRKLAALKA
jgi:hypothetical protein